MASNPFSVHTLHNKALQLPARQHASQVNFFQSGLDADRRPRLKGSRYFAFEPMQETLTKIYDHEGWLSRVTIARFGGDRPFVTGLSCVLGRYPQHFARIRMTILLSLRSGPWLRLSTKPWSMFPPLLPGLPALALKLGGSGS